mmetsp:Transcript_55839/g.90489  ORF Transcript_55839/g.90489 Transcript_55839/m.90489 type:complete len:130 (+) Transcript_55839:1-390(+)
MHLVAVGGLVVYSTCSMNPVEDEAVVLSCLRGRAEFTLVDVSSKLEGLWWSSGVQDWTVTDSRGATYSSWQEVPQDAAQSEGLLESMFPLGGAEPPHQPLDRCVRLLPHVSHTGGVFRGSVAEDTCERY